jgi:hypothetical protein
MAPGKSARQKAVDALQARFQGMTDANLYHYPVAASGQVTANPTLSLLTGVGLPDLPVYQLEVSPDGSKEYYPGEQLKEELFVNVYGRMDGDSADQEGRMAVWENMVADLETAICLDVTLGGLVCDTRLLEPAPFVGVGTNIVIVSAAVRMTIYRAYRNGI